jgi:hypothetical protein
MLYVSKATIILTFPTCRFRFGGASTFRFGDLLCAHVRSSPLRLRRTLPQHGPKAGIDLVIASGVLEDG